MRTSLARLAALALLAVSLVTLSPSAANAEPCPAPPANGLASVGTLACDEAPLAYADATYVGGGDLLVKGWTNGWSLGTIRVNATLYFDGVAVWTSGTRTCYSTNSCSTPTSTLDCGCWAGWVELRVWGSKNNGGKVWASDWEYIPPGL
ncbi:hypothetical protein [Catellatospora chokoriensis]|uniref:Secreted protein n=1 Tax=Catellatospora chokoriensis TaxID=310353 RepID=A0A8J3NU00_9ACTN|nr:hypothetical protein [Catellatospora chokoriensis]GIF92246.1 hypothetical protein Cch02nite_56900 [Catellatospora chokoriensis]